MAAALGTVTSNPQNFRSVCLGVAINATNAAPSLATDGVPNYPVEKIYASDTGACFQANAARESMLSLRGTGTGTVTGTFIIWGFLAAGTAGANGPNGGSGFWVPVVKVNAGTAISITAPSGFAERELNLGLYDRLYLQCTAITGTSAAWEAWLSTARAGGQGC